MNDMVPISELEVIGFLGRFSVSDWPLRLLPVYRSRSEPFGFVPPFEQQAGSLRGVRVSVAELEEMIDEGEITPLKATRQAQDEYALWMGEDGPRYEPRVEAERALDAISLDAVGRAAALGLSKGAARVQLFRALRARSTAVATALLSVHFQLNDDFSQVKPIREDLVQFGSAEPASVETGMVDAVLAKDPPRKVLSAIASELRSAGRDALAQVLLRDGNASDHWAARPAPPMRWGQIGKAA
jgi:hypothetical protein